MSARDIAETLTAYTEMRDTELVEEVFRLLDAQEAEHEYALGLALGLLESRAFEREMAEE